MNPQADESIRICLRLLASEQSDVKRLALTKILWLLRNHRNEAVALILGSKQLSPEIADLVTALIDNLRSCEDPEVRRLILSCFGELGAIDPGRLGLELAAPTCPGRAPKDRRPPAVNFADFKGCVGQIENAKARVLFKSASIMAERDCSFSSFLLPHVIVYGLTEAAGSTMETETKQEIVAVLSSCGTNGSLKVDFVHMAAQTVFGLLDLVKRWLITYETDTEKKREVGKLKSFLSSLPLDLVTSAAVNCRSYARALMFSEIQMKSQLVSPGCDDYFFRIQKLYSSIMEADGVLGAVVEIKNQREPKPEEIVLALEAVGDYNKALPYHAKAARDNPNNVESQIGLIKCLLSLNQPEVAHNYMENFIQKGAETVFSQSDWIQLNSVRVEAAWKLQEWNIVDTVLENEEFKQNTWGFTISDLMCTAKNKNWTVLSEKLKLARENIIGPLIASTMETGAYERAYPYICQLHIFVEIEQAAEAISQQKDLSDLEGGWEHRLKLMQGSTRHIEPVLEVRRQLINICPVSDRMKQYKQKCWLQSAKFSRSAGHLQTAWGSLVQAKEVPTIRLPDTFIEESRLHWATNEKEEAISVLGKGIEEHFKDLAESNPEPATASSHTRQRAEDEKLTFVKAQILLNRYSFEASAAEGTQILSKFAKAGEIYGSYEQLWYRYATFVDTMQSKTKERMKAEKEKNEKYLEDINKFMKQCFRAIPRQQFYAGFSQLLSRITHPSESVWEVLKNILAGLIAEYPGQCLWQSIGLLKSDLKSRKPERCKAVYHEATKRNVSVNALEADLRNLTKLLMELASNGNIKNNADLHQASPELYNFFGKRDQQGTRGKRSLSSSKSKILIPIHAQMEMKFVTSRTGTFCSNSQDSNTDVAFETNRQIYIDHVENKLQVYASQEKPKRVTLRGSDGHEYYLLCKPTDDLYKDKRLMEFNQVVNACLREDSEARRRQLHVRTYCVTPLGSSGGLVEWVPNLVAMRNALMPLFAQPMTLTEWKRNQAPRSLSLGIIIKLRDTFSQVESSQEAEGLESALSIEIIHVWFGLGGTIACPVQTDMNNFPSVLERYFHIFQIEVGRHVRG